jgi:TPR repeat protein
MKHFLALCDLLILQSLACLLTVKTIHRACGFVLLSTLVSTSYIQPASAQTNNISALDPVINKADKEAFDNMLPAAKLNNTAAQRIIANMYEHGEGVEKSLINALYWYQKAADLDDDIAQFYLGYLYHQAIGVKQNYRQAFIWFSKAAHHGNPDFQFNLGNLYRYGEGVGADINKGVSWYLLAAEQDHPIAQAELAMLYFQGFEIDTDLISAYFWQSLLPQDTTQARQLKDIAKIMTPAQIRAAKVKVDNWISHHREKD